MINQFFSSLFGKKSDLPTETSHSENEDTLTNKIQTLIGSGDTSKAISLLIDAGYSDALLLQSQYIKGEELFNKGKIQYPEWMQTQNRIAFAIMSLINPTPEPISDSKENIDLPVSPTPDVPITKELHEQIQDLISQDQLKEALALCNGLGLNFILINSRFTDAHKLWHLGLITHEDWINQKMRIKESLLYALESHPK